MRILFDSKLSQFKTPFGTVKPGERCRLRVDIPVSCRSVKAEAVFLREDGVSEAFRAALRKSEENELYEGMVEDDVDYLELALTFYLYLNDMDGDFLDNNGYSREEVLDGMKELASDWGVTGLEAF